MSNKETLLELLDRSPFADGSMHLSCENWERISSALRKAGAWLEAHDLNHSGADANVREEREAFRAALEGTDDV
jgi:hypothetical protein